MMDCRCSPGGHVPAAVDPGRRPAGTDSEDDDSEEIAEIVPAAIVGDRVDSDVRHEERHDPGDRDRKSTRLNSSHLVISYAVFCLKKKTTDSSEATNVKHLSTDSNNT